MAFPGDEWGGGAGGADSRPVGAWVLCRRCSPRPGPRRGRAGRSRAAPRGEERCEPAARPWGRAGGGTGPRAPAGCSPRRCPRAVSSGRAFPAPGVGGASGQWALRPQWWGSALCRQPHGEDGDRAPRCHPLHAPWSCPGDPAKRRTALHRETLPSLQPLRPLCVAFPPPCRPVAVTAGTQVTGQMLTAWWPRCHCEERHQSPRADRRGHLCCFQQTQSQPPFGGDRVPLGGSTVHGPGCETGSPRTLGPSGSHLGAGHLRS